MGGNDINWNTFFIQSDSILRHNAKALQATKAQLLAVDQRFDGADDNGRNSKRNDMAVTTTVAEAAVIAKTKDFLSEHGIDIDQFNQSKTSTVRSRTVILVKNFPYYTKQEDLLKVFSGFGTVSKFVLPDTKACAVVEYAD